MLSVAVPTYGKSYYLTECLESIFAQTIKVECIVCDGESEFSFDDSRWSWVKHISIKPDPGMVGCWSIAANNANTKYISFLADDNAWEPTFAEKMVDFLEANPNCDVVFCNQLFIRNNGCVDYSYSQSVNRSYGRDILESGIIDKAWKKHIIKYNSIPLEACVIRKTLWDMYGSFEINAYGAFDLHFFLNMLTSDVTFGFVQEPLCRFRIHSDSYTTRKQEEHIRGSIWALKSIIIDNSHFDRIIFFRLLEFYFRLAKLYFSKSRVIRFFQNTN